MTLIVNLQNLQQETDSDEGKENDLSIKFETKLIKPYLCDYSDVYVLLIGDTLVTNGNAATNVAFKNCAPYRRCVTLSNFFRSLELPLINCKTHLELNWTNNRITYDGNEYDNDDDNNNDTTFKITSTKLYVPIITLKSKDNANLTKRLNEGFKRSVYWNKYKTEIESKEVDNNPERF